MAVTAPYIWPRFFENDGVTPLAGGTLETFEAGTVTPKATYTDATEDTAHPNPIVLDAEGYIQNNPTLWLGEGGYKFILKDSSGVTIKTADDIVGAVPDAFAGTVVDVSTNTVVNLTNASNTYLATGTLTLSLPAAADAGNSFVVFVKNVGTGDVTIDPDGSETIDGAATLLLRPGDSVAVRSDGTAWFTLFSTAGRDVDFTKRVAFVDAGELTIATGEITVTGSNHTVDTEGDAATDDLDTINGGRDGGLLLLRANNANRTVILKSGSGNIVTSDANDIVLTTTNQSALLVYDDANDVWVANQLTRVLNGYIDGFNLSLDTDTDHDIEIAAGLAADSTNNFYIAPTTAVVKQIDADWAAGDAAGGMPRTTQTGTYSTSSTTVTGTATAFDTEFAVGDTIYSATEATARRITAIASATSMTIQSAFPSPVSGDNAEKGGLAPTTWYRIFTISNVATGAVDFGFDTAADASNLLEDSGFTNYRYVGHFLTDASANIDDVTLSSKQAFGKVARYNVSQPLNATANLDSNGDGVWSTKNPSAINRNEIFGIYEINGVITLLAGEYFVEAFTTQYGNASTGQMRFRDVTNTATVILGQTARSDPALSANFHFNLLGGFTSTDTANYSLQQFGQGGAASNFAFGFNNFSTSESNNFWLLDISINNG